MIYDRKINTSVNRVYVKALDTYDSAAVKDVVYPVISGMLEDNGIIKEDLSGKKVLIKPNLLARREAKAGITTHPAFVAACAEYFLELGADVTVADSPGGTYSVAVLEAIYRTTGLSRACEDTGAKLNTDVSFGTVRRNEISAKSFNIIKPIVQTDLVVNVCRLKTHALCEISAAVKNMFGSIPGLQKAEQHARFPQRDAFADMLCDLCLITAPQINIVDGVVGMEGNGPAGGTLKNVGAVIASANPFACDIASAFVMGYKPEEVGTLKCAVKRGLCPKSVKELDIVGENPERFASDFVRPDASAGGLLKQLPTIFGGRLQKLLEPRPTVNKALCVGCGECARNCPVSAISVEQKKAHIHSSECIKCYCCQEFCPAKAIKVKHFFLLKK